MNLGSRSRVLAGVALALLMTGGAAWAAPQSAQQQREQQQQRQYEAQQRDAQQQEQQGQHNGHHATKKDKQPALYPNATRKSPALTPVGKRDADQLNSGLAAANAHNEAMAKKILEPYAEGKASDNRYLQAVALQALANIEYNAGNVKQAIAKLQQALATNALPNDQHFQLMYELAQFYDADKQYQQALDTLHKWRQEGRRETADSYGMEGILDYQLQHYKEAIAAINKAKSMTNQPHKTWDQVLAVSYAQTGQGDQAIKMAKQQLAANPDDAGMRHNLISLLMSSGKNDEALAEMEKARSMGQLTASDGYMNLARLYLQAGQDSGKDPKPYADKAIAALKEGVSKGVVKPDYAYYKLLGAANRIGGYDKAALDAYTKAAPMGSDGSAELSRAELLAADNKYSASRSAAHKALAKGTKHKGIAYVLIAKAERALGNKPAAVTAMKKAAQYPETHTQAMAWLKKAGY